MYAYDGADTLFMSYSSHALLGLAMALWYVMCDSLCVCKVLSTPNRNLITDKLLWKVSLSIMRAISWETRFVWNSLMVVVELQSILVSLVLASSVVSMAIGLGQFYASLELKNVLTLHPRECPNHVVPL